MGSTNMDSTATRRRARQLAIATMALIWTAGFLTLTAFGVEWYLSRGKSYQHAPYYSQLDRSYDAFRIQHLNPFYMFFFPLERDARIALGNDVVSIDADGFRGRGPGHADGRKLVFFLGGSSAFGWYSSFTNTRTSSINTSSRFPPSIRESGRS